MLWWRMAHEMITDPNLFFTKGCGRCDKFDTPACNALRWGDALGALRDLCRASGCTETAKWGHPCYVHADRNIAIIGAFKDDVRLTFFKAGLLKDPDRVLEKQGPNTATAGMMRFHSAGDVDRLAPTIRKYLAEAMDYADRGLLPPKVDNRPDMPPELSDVLDSDPELAEAFHALPPGRQKSYLINLNGAKQSATRINRIAKFRAKIIAGKGATDR